MFSLFYQLFQYLLVQNAVDSQDFSSNAKERIFKKQIKTTNWRRLARTQQATRQREKPEKKEGTDKLVRETGKARSKKQKARKTVKTEKVQNLTNFERKAEKTMPYGRENMNLE